MIVFLMMKSNCIIAAAFLAICARPVYAQDQTSYDRDAAAVIRAALDSLYTTNGTMPGTVLLYDSLARPATLEQDKELVRLLAGHAIDSTTIADFYARAVPFIPYGTLKIPGTPYPKGFRYPRVIFKSFLYVDSLARAVTHANTSPT